MVERGKNQIVQGLMGSGKDFGCSECSGEALGRFVQVRERLGMIFSLRSSLGLLWDNRLKGENGSRETRVRAPAILRGRCQQLSCPCQRLLSACLPSLGVGSREQSLQSNPSETWLQRLETGFWSSSPCVPWSRGSELRCS